MYFIEFKGEYNGNTPKNSPFNKYFKGEPDGNTPKIPPSYFKDSFLKVYIGYIIYCFARIVYFIIPVSVDAFLFITRALLDFFPSEKFQLTER